MAYSPKSVAVVEMNSTESRTKVDNESGETVVRAQGRRSLAGIIYRPPIDAQPGHYKLPPPPGPPEPRIVRSVGADFKKKLTNAVLEVLLEEPRVSVRSRIRKTSQGGCDYLSQRTELTDSLVVRQNPKRIRIQSPRLFEFFGSIPASVGNSFNMPGTTSVVFLHPFKLFVTLEPYIRKRLAELEQADRERQKNPSHSLLKGDDDLESTISRPQLGQQRSPVSAANDDEETLQHLRLLIEVFDTDLKHLLEMRRQIQNRTLKSIAYTDLWLLFEHGQDVKTPDSRLQVYRVLRWTGGREVLAKHSLYTELQTRAIAEGQSIQKADIRTDVFIVECVSFEFDGEQYGPIQKTFMIRKYDGLKPITKLSIHPLAFAPDSDAIRERLIRRGIFHMKRQIDSQIIVDIREAVLRYYTNFPRIGITNLTEHNLRETYEETVNPTVTNGVCSEDGCCDNECVHKDYDWELQREAQVFEEHKTILEPTTDPEDIDDEEKILLPPYVYGFVLRSRKWAMFDIDLIREVDYTSGFEDLVLPAGHKETGEMSMDLVKGKGKGLVILLHGAPGVGKTSTAECVADTTKRPLFPITCGDIGDTASEVETNLEKNFQLAHKWGCVLLLDEADIFLQKRDKADIKRNAIVSVFLRTMEYYSGILFLTTNRVGTFDQAFRSRIHISLYYPGLQKEATMQIWKMHLGRTQKLKGSKFKIRTKEILKFAKNHYMELKKAQSGSWNGRQIRNAFQTAIALAEFEASEGGSPGTNSKHGIELKEQHFATVAEASKEFDKYLRSTQGGQTEADLARLEQTRVDDFHKLAKKIEQEQKARQKTKRRGKVDVDSEETQSSDSEDSDDDSESASGSSEKSEDESVFLKLARNKMEREGKSRKSRGKI
ncbi:hypothetical protein CONLIGDRAFT_679961 [Coniochaeta ligniaria NRRL 30616]|uniref:AAA+ ATPase domain-containing protein n=1 Tax=Coniochaeta ligniaria NRRL 30616 TaxID=1408157 RepID=A0A1J7JU17_9PEZI|nr:hypothetical protein CONLIGDRAFT_679961 [Coniochaeta ligniaria NRRL 30616]